MQRISITNPQNIIDGTAKKYYFKLRNTGGPKGDKGDKGDTGQTGPQGPKGDAATVAVGSTTTLAVGQDATVENVGSIYNAVLNFGIPQGPQGPQGAKGDKGDTGAQGETGPRGPQGERGTNATVYIGTTSTLNPGSQATVYNSGTDSNAVLNFGIPKGEKGDTGPMPTIAQTTGQAIDQVMSQKATTDALNTKQATITSSNKLSADLVDDTSTTNKFVTAEDKTTWNAKQDALTAGNNIDIEDGVISTPAIAPEVVAELPTTGTEGKLYLTPKNYTGGTGTGNPITATITDEAGKMESFKLDGDTYQQSYEGKNLIEPKMASATSNGITCTNNGDGSFTLNGTASATATFRLDQSSSNASDNLKNYSGTYTLSCDELTDGMGLYVMQINTWTQYLVMRNSNTPVTGSVDATGIFIYVGVFAGTKLDNLTIHPMFEKSATATSYEPYVGGQPSPNPDYPQPIQTVTGEQTVEIVGKNLFDETWSKGQYDNGVWHPDAFDGERATTNLIPVTGGDYSISLNSDTLYTSFININYFDADKNWLGNRTTLGLDAFSDTDRTKSFTLPDTAYYLAVSIRPYHGYSGQTVYVNAPSQMLQVERSSANTPYAAYSKQTLPLNLGKNLFDGTIYKTDYVLSSNGAETPFDNAVITSSIKVQPNTTYTASANIQSKYDKYMRVGIYQGDMTFISRPSSSAQDGKLTFTTPANAQYVRLSYFVPATDVQLEAGSQASTYAPYKTPIELCKLGTYQDYIFKDGEDWKVHKATAKQIINGNSQVGYQSQPNATSSVVKVPRVSATNTLNLFSSTHFSVGSQTDNRLVISTSGSDNIFYLRLENRITGAAYGTASSVVPAFVSWLTANPVSVIYSLATATDTAITDQTLIAQLEAIRTASLENGTNTITNSTPAPNLAGDMEIGYYGYDPTNRYDKWLWLDLNNNYEQIGS